jgi:signal transduction histidine kinase/CHASE3 domain sensor protein
MLWSERSIAHALRRTLALMAVLMVLTGLGGTVTVYFHHRSVAELEERVLPLRLANTQLRAEMADGQREIRGYLLSGDPGALDGFRTALAGYPARFTEVAQLASGPERRQVDAQVRRAEAWLTLADRQTRMVPRSQEAGAVVVEGERLFNRFLFANTALDASLAGTAATLRNRGDRTRSLSFMWLVISTGGAVILATLVAMRSSTWIAGALDPLLHTLDRLRAGDRAARAPVTGPLEIAAVGRAINEMAEDAERRRIETRERTRLRVVARELGVRIREPLDVDSVVSEAASSAGQELDADLVVVRLVGSGHAPSTAVWWTRTRPGVVHRADQEVPESADAWLRHLYAKAELCSIDDLRTDEGDLPERQSLLAAGAVSVLVVPFSTGTLLAGALTLVRTRDGVPWQPAEKEAAEAVAADLGRGVGQADQYQRERRLVAELREADRTRTDFLSTVSHELRTPLTSISGFVGLLREPDSDPITPHQQHMLEVIDRNAVRLRHLIEDLLTLSRIDAGTFATAHKPINLGAIMSAAVTSLEPAARSGGLTLSAEFPEEPLIAMADPDQIERVVVNLLSNAVKFTLPGGTVTARLAVVDDRAAISVQDTGIGIPQEEQSALSERFFRASNAVIRAIPGTGLGLTIVRTIVANHDGELEITSQEGRGTTVTVRLPLGLA